MCSGTDAPVPVVQKLAKVLGLKVEHVFSCEFHKKKQGWIKANFPNLKYLFGDVKALQNGWAVNELTGQEVEVPEVDIIIAGFV